MLRTFVAAVVALVLVAGGLLAEEVKGKVKSVDAEKMTLTVTTEDGQSHVINLDNNTKLTDTKGKDLKAGVKSKSLKPGTEVTVTYETKDGQKVGTHVQLGHSAKQ
jgi:hypothetical protein